MKHKVEYGMNLLLMRARMRAYMISKKIIHLLS